MTVENDLYDYGLKIYQDSDFFKFSLDSILLAEFVNARHHDRILDICTGNAPIPLILANADETLEIHGLELQSEVYNLATLSVQKNGLDERIRIFHIDAKEFQSDDKYDIVTCNPPYFEVTSSSLKNENPIKRLARHEIAITLKDTIAIAKKHLKEKGTFYMVHRTDRFLETLHLLEEAKFGIRKIAFVFTKTNAPAEFFLIEASTYKKNDPKIIGVTTKERTTYQGIFEEV